MLKTLTIAEQARSQGQLLKLLFKRDRKSLDMLNQGLLLEILLSTHGLLMLAQEWHYLKTLSDTAQKQGYLNQENALKNVFRHTNA